MIAGDHDALAVLDRQTQGFGEPRFGVGFDDDAIDDRFDGVVFTRVERREAFDVAQLAIDADADEAGFADRFEHRLMLAFAAADQRGEQHEPGSFREPDQPLLDLFGRLLADGLAAAMAFGFAEACVEQPQEVVDFGRRRDGAAGIAGADSLVDADRGRQAVEAVDVGPFERMQELAGVDRQCFEVLALAFGVERIEGEAAFAGAAGAGEHDQFVAGNIDVDVFQIVDAGSAELNPIVVGGGVSWSHKRMAGSGGWR